MVAEKKKLSAEEEREKGGAGAAKVKMNDVADKNNYQSLSDRLNLIHSR